MNDGIYRVRVKIGGQLVTRVYAIVDGEEANWSNHCDIRISTLEDVDSATAVTVLAAIGNRHALVDVMRVRDSAERARVWASGATEFQKSRIR